MTEIVQQPEAKTKKPKAKKAAQPSRTARIRTLLTEGRSVAEIAAVLGVTKQMIYNVAYTVRKKEKNAKRISPRTGKPLRKYTKRPAKPAPTPTPTPPKVQYIEVEVPQPHYNLTWGQRFKALFTGRV